MTLEQFLEKINQADQAAPIAFSDTINVIDAHYAFTPSSFKNGSHLNTAGQNNGSCKIFAFALLHKLNKEQTLQCFGDYYRIEVCQHPEADDHQNIRNFMLYGWEGVYFEHPALKPK